MISQHPAAVCPRGGAALFGHPGVEAEYLEQVLDGTPLFGMMGPYQVGPAGRGGAPELLTYSAVLALVAG